MMTNKKWLASQCNFSKGNNQGLLLLSYKIEYLLCATYDSKISILD